MDSHQSQAANEQQNNNFYNTHVVTFSLAHEPVLFRDKEIQRIVEILGKKHHGNVMIIGGRGSGKTSLMQGAIDSIKKTLGKDVIQVNGHYFFHKVQSKAHFDEVFLSTLSQFQMNQNKIAYFDNFDTLFKEYRGNEFEMDLLMATFLEPNHIKCVVSISKENYDIFKNSWFASLFEPVFLKDLSEEELNIVIESKKVKIEEHYNINFHNKYIPTLLNLTNKFISNVSNPKSSLNILESAASHVVYSQRPKLSNDDRIVINEFEETINGLTQQYQVALKNREFTNAAKIKKEIIEYENVLREYINAATPSNGKVLNVTDEHVRNIISEITTIPVQKLNENTFSKVRGLEDELNKQVVNQAVPIKSITNAIKRNVTGLRDDNRPIGVFMFVGSTGTGKTYLSKVLAETFYTSQKDIIRLDMSEYADQISVNKLFGSAPGYVGYEEGGVLTRAVANHPYSIILFDEIEKAHPIVHNSLLSIFDDGQMTDNKGNKISFKNNIIILTSNVGCHAASLKTSINKIGFGVNETQKTEDFKTVVQASIKERFTPEFINRIDDIIIFNSLTQEDIKKIMILELQKISSRLKKNGISLKIKKGIEDNLFEAKKDILKLEYGAREVKRVLNELESELADFILNNNKKTITVDFNQKYILK